MTFKKKMNKDSSMLKSILKTQKKMENKLPYPFNKAFERGDSIDYKVGNWSDTNDHEYVKKLGYEPHMMSDCSMYAEGLGAFNLSSYGDWGTFFSDWADEKQKDMFLDMVEKDIIRPWRITAYIKNGEGVVSYSYENGSGWSKNDKEYGWVDCKDPYKEKQL